MSPRSRPSPSTRPNSWHSTGIDRVEGPFAITDPATGLPLSPEEVAALYALEEGQRPPGIDILLEQYIRGNTIQLAAISPLAPSTPRRPT